MVAIRDLLWEFYSVIARSANLRAAEVAQAYPLHCCKAACQLNYLFLDKAVTLAVANVACGWFGSDVRRCR